MGKVWEFMGGGADQNWENWNRILPSYSLNTSQHFSLQVLLLSSSDHVTSCQKVILLIFPSQVRHSTEGCKKLGYRMCRSEF